MKYVIYYTESGFKCWPNSKKYSLRRRYSIYNEECKERVKFSFCLIADWSSLTPMNTVCWVDSGWLRILVSLVFGNGLGDWEGDGAAGKMNIIHLWKRQEHNGESIMLLNWLSFFYVYSIFHFHRSCWSSSLVRMNLTVPSLSKTQPPFGLWLSKVNSAGPPCWFQPALDSNRSTVSGGESYLQYGFMA